MMLHDLHHFFLGQHVFVTGASGFIGSHVASLLVQAGAHVRAFTRSTKGRCDSAIDWVEGDLLRRDSIDAAMKDCRYVFHLAGDYRFWARDSREIFANNVQGTINLLEAAKRGGVEKIVCTSTTGILEPGTLDRLASEERLASPLSIQRTLQTLQVSELSRSKKKGGRRLAHRDHAAHRADRPTRPETDANWNDRGRIFKRTDSVACPHGTQLRRCTALRTRSSSGNGAGQVR